MTYERYLDKVYGCFLGKTVLGTLGAPYEGIKMPLALPFREEMIKNMLPNDDLDLQILWLDVAERYGKDFTSLQLLERFVSCCDYSPGEYAIMRKNYHKGIYPPLSGEFCNDFYRQGMGCPIRSEIWACLAPSQPAQAAQYAARDGVLDHKGESVWAEQFMAALEALAFEESDLERLISEALKVVPKEAKFRGLVEDTVAWCRQYDDPNRILRKILHKYGHPDCTNLFQNMGITLMALLKGELDMVKTGMMALNCGFDTDCTCASAGAVIGCILGADALIRQYGLGDVRFVAGVRTNRRSDSVYDLACDIATLYCDWADTPLCGAPAVSYTYEKAEPLSFAVAYGATGPSISIGEQKNVTLKVKAMAHVGATHLTVAGLGTKEELRLTLTEGEEAEVPLTFAVPQDTTALAEKNIIRVTYETETGEGAFTFGLSGATPWKVTGPIWQTEPLCLPEDLERDPNYLNLIKHHAEGQNLFDVLRQFHLNFSVDTETEFLTEEELFAPLCEDRETRYEEGLFSVGEDNFSMDEAFGFRGPCVCYLSAVLLSDRDRTVCAQVGHSAPFVLYANGKEMARRDHCDGFTPENVHVEGIDLKKGENRIVLRLTRVNGEAKYGLIFSDKSAFGAHIVDFSYKNPKAW